MIIAITQTAALISAPLFGFLTDRINRVSALNLTLLLPFGLRRHLVCGEPLGAGMILCGVLIGMSEVGLHRHQFGADCAADPATAARRRDRGVQSLWGGGNFGGQQGRRHPL